MASQDKDKPSSGMQHGAGHKPSDDKSQQNQQAGKQGQAGAGAGGPDNEKSRHMEQNEKDKGGHSQRR